MECFGDNWDALHDCLTDRAWLRTDVVVLGLTDAAHFRAEAVFVGSWDAFRVGVSRSWKFLREKVVANSHEGTFQSSLS